MSFQQYSHTYICVPVVSQYYTTKNKDYEITWTIYLLDLYNVGQKKKSFLHKYFKFSLALRLRKRKKTLKYDELLQCRKYSES